MSPVRESVALSTPPHTIILSPRSTRSSTRSSRSRFDRIPYPSFDRSIANGIHRSPPRSRSVKIERHPIPTAHVVVGNNGVRAPGTRDPYTESELVSPPGSSQEDAIEISDDEEVNLIIMDSRDELARLLQGTSTEMQLDRGSTANRVPEIQEESQAIVSENSSGDKLPSLQDRDTLVGSGSARLRRSPRRPQPSPTIRNHHTSPTNISRLSPVSLIAGCDSINPYFNSPSADIPSYDDFIRYNASHTQSRSELRDMYIKGLEHHVLCENPFHRRLVVHAAKVLYKNLGFNGWTPRIRAFGSQSRENNGHDNPGLSSSGREENRPARRRRVSIGDVSQFRSELVRDVDDVMRRHMRANGFRAAPSRP